MIHVNWKKRKKKKRSVCASRCIFFKKPFYSLKIYSIIDVQLDLLKQINKAVFN